MIKTASWGRRILALIVDWVASTLVVMLVIGVGGWSEDPLAAWWVLLVFILESTLLTALLGGSFGKLATGLRVIRVDASGRPLDLLRALVRSLLIALVIPPVVFRPEDNRGLHDMAAGSVVVPLNALGN